MASAAPTAPTTMTAEQAEALLQNTSWKRSARLRAEFVNSFAAYSSFREGVLNGTCRRSGKSRERELADLAELEAG